MKAVKSESKLFDEQIIHKETSRGGGAVDQIAGAAIKGLGLSLSTGWDGRARETRERAKQHMASKRRRSRARYQMTDTAMKRVMMMIMVMIVVMMNLIESIETRSESMNAYSSKAIRSRKRLMNEKRRRSIDGEAQKHVDRKQSFARGRDRSDLGSLSFNLIQDGLVGRVTEARIQSFFLIMLISVAQPFRTKIKGVAEWFVDALKDITTGHEDLIIFNRNNNDQYPIQTVGEREDR